MEKKKTLYNWLQSFVRMKGLEPPHLSVLDPKSSAATNYATSAEVKKCKYTIFFEIKRKKITMLIKMSKKISKNIRMSTLIYTHFLLCITVFKLSKSVCCTYFFFVFYNKFIGKVQTRQWNKR